MYLEKKTSARGSEERILSRSAILHIKMTDYAITIIAQLMILQYLGELAFIFSPFFHY
jgi:hypothetical protein